MLQIPWWSHIKGVKHNKSLGETKWNHKNNELTQEKEIKKQQGNRF